MKILIAGDYYPGIIDNKNTIEDALKELRAVCNESDYSIINFESPISSQWDKPIAKCGPALKSNEVAARCLYETGFNCVTLANNHVLDQGERTLLHTITLFDKIGLDTVGAGENIQDSGKVLYKKIGDETLAIINCCEKEFSVATENHPGANPLNPVQQFYSINEARKKADYVIVIVHGGHEHYPLPSPRMKELYHFFIDCGADSVINHHQHCYSGYEFYKDKPIIYGLGNLLFDGGKRHSGRWNEGYVVQLSTDKGQISIDLIPYEQCKNDFSVRLIKDQTDFKLEIKRLNNIISNQQLLIQNFNEWTSENKGSYRSCCIPYDNRFLRKAANLGWIPDGLDRDHLLQMLNYVQCEAHRDLFISFLQSKCQ